MSQTKTRTTNKVKNATRKHWFGEPLEPIEREKSKEELDVKKLQKQFQLINSSRPKNRRFSTNPRKLRRVSRQVEILSQQNQDVSLNFES